MTKLIVDLTHGRHDHGRHDKTTKEGSGNRRDTTACCDNSSSPDEIEMASTRSEVQDLGGK